MDAFFVFYYSAREKAKEQLTVLYEKALKEVGEVNAMIFEVHKMMARIAVWELAEPFFVTKESTLDLSSCTVSLGRITRRKRHSLAHIKKLRKIWREKR